MGKVLQGKYCLVERVTGWSQEGGRKKCESDRNGKGNELVT
jgi:hypothetical protein